MAHSHRIRVRGFHCDFYGHVNNARYLEFLEEARWAYLEAGLDLQAWKDRGLGFIVAAVSINYRRPAGLNIDLEVRSHLASIGGKSGVIRQEVVDVASGKTVADADVTFVIADLESGRAVAMSEEIVAMLKLSEEPGAGTPS